MLKPPHPSNEPDPIAEQLRAAGPRSPLPPFDLEHLSAPALEAWQHKVDRQRFRRRSMMALAATITLATIGAWLLWTSSPASIATVEAYSGSQPTHFPVGSALGGASRLTTSSQPKEWLAVRLASGHRLRLDAGTEIELVSASRVDLLVGAVYIEAAPAELAVHAAGTVSTHLGTRYAVRINSNGNVAIHVREGHVRVTSGQQTTELDRGQVGSAEADGTLIVGAFPPYGDAWHWTRQAAPVFDADGQSLEAFLAWVAAESGWLVNVDPELLRDQHDQPIEVRGSIDHLTLSEALDLVLEGAGLGYQLDRDQLRIYPLPGELDAPP